MPATLTFNQGYNEIARLAVERSLHWVSQLSKKLGNELVPDDKIARGITKRFLFFELINIGIELSRSAFVEVNKIHFLACGCTCRRFWSLDNAGGESAEKLFSEFDKYQKTVAAQNPISLPGKPGFSDSLVGNATQVCYCLAIPLNSKAGELVTAASVGAVDASQRTSMYLRILDQVDPSDPNVKKGPERFPLVALLSRIARTS
jgi:hypothetical protein